MKTKGSLCDFISLMLCSGVFIFWSYLLLTKYYSFGYYDWDLAFFSQALWSLAHGKQHVSLFGINFFSNHSNFIAYFLTPFYCIVPHPMVLVGLKLLSFTGAGYLLYTLGKEKIGGIWAIIIMLSYFLYPVNIFALIYEFDFESLAPFFLVLLFYLFNRGYYAGFLVVSLLTMLIKENMPLMISFLGILGLFSKKEKVKWGFIPFALGLSTFYILTYKVIPHFTQGSHYYLAFYRGYGNSPFGIILSIIAHPWQILKTLADPYNLNVLLELLVPLIFLPLLSPQILFLSFPLLFQQLLSSAHQQHTIFYNYYFSIAPFIFIALIHSLKLIKEKGRAFTFLLAIVAVFMMTLLRFLVYQDESLKRLHFHQDGLNPKRWEMVKTIPKDGAVLASFDFLAALSTRHELYAFHKIYNDFYQNPSYSFILPQHIQYTLIDFNDLWLKNEFAFRPMEIAKRVQRLFEGNDWYVLQGANDIVLLTKSPTSFGKLIEYTHASSHETLNVQNVLLKEPSLQLTGFEIKNTEPLTLPITFYWQGLDSMNENYSMFFFVKQNNQMLYYHHRTIGYTVYPTMAWEKGGQLKEQYWLVLPPLPKGSYSLEIGLFNSSIKERITSLDELKTLKLKDIIIK